jgi:hypothetical protein
MEGIANPAKDVVLESACLIPNDFSVKGHVRMHCASLFISTAVDVIDF